jgi:hypothetical protein
MSGLILPGKGSTPQGEAKIELPSGFGSRRREEKTAEAPPADGKSPSSPEPTAPADQPPQRARRASDLLFPPTGAQVQCPNCGTPYVVPVFTILDLGANPELKGALLGGQINVAQCPNCGAGGPLSAPLMVHAPDRQFLGVVIPPEARLNDIQRQKVIGDMTQTLMRKLPTEARKGYLFQPRQFLDWQRFMEQMWEFEGVTPEMLRRQRGQAELLQSLVALGNDRKALEIALQRSGELVDRNFFALLDRMLMMMSAQATGGDVERLLQLRANLLELTPAGQQIAEQQNRIRAVLAKITPQTTREQLLDILLDAWQQPDGREVVGAIILAAGALFDYQFLMAVTERADSAGDASVKATLEEIRQLVLSSQEQQRQSQQAVIQQAQQVLQEVLQSANPADTLRQYAEYIDEVFLSLVAANAQNAERKNSTAAARRFRQIYDLAVEIMQEGMPAEVQLVNRLLSAPDKAALNALLEENREQLTPELIAALRQMEDELRQTDRSQLADRVKSLRGQIALKM